MKKLYGYLMKGMEAGMEKTIMERMLAHGCERIFLEESYDAFRRLAWRELMGTVGEEDCIVYPRLSHLADGTAMLMKIAKEIQRKSLHLYYLTNYLNDSQLKEESIGRILEYSYLSEMGHREWLATAMKSMWKLTEQQFPNLNTTIKRNIWGCRLLQFSMAQSELSSFYKEFGNQTAVRWRDFAHGEYRKYLLGMDRELFEKGVYGDKYFPSEWYLCL